MKYFTEIRAAAQGVDARPALAVVAPDAHTLEAARAAEREGLVRAVYFADRASATWLTSQLAAGEAEICMAEDQASAARAAVRAAHDGEVGMILKGKIGTGTLLKQVVNKTYGLATGTLMSHVGFVEVPSYHKLLIVTDGGMVPYPTREQKAVILCHALEVMRLLGEPVPKAALLAAVETVNPKMPETVDAAELKAQAEAGAFGPCVVEGPISFDLAYYPEAAALKGYESPVAGEADILLTPDMVSGNLLAKSLVYAAGGKMAGIIAGAKVPVLINSRSASAEEKLNAIAVAACLARAKDEEAAR